MATDLQELVRARLGDLGLSYRQAAARADGQVSHATLGAIVSGRHSGKLSDSAAAGIAAALDVPVDDVRRAAGQVAKRVEFVLPDRASRLSPRSRKALIATLDALLAAEDAAAAAEAAVRDVTPGPSLTVTGDTPRVDTGPDEPSNVPDTSPDGKPTRRRRRAS